MRGLVTSKIEDVLSSLHTEEDKGIYNLILSAVLLSIAKNINDLYNLTTKTLLSVQEIRLGVKIKEVTDKAILALLEKEVLKIKGKKPLDNNSKETEKSVPSDDAELELSSLGRAAMKGFILFVI